jgi:phenol hydroxylase P1 protein
MNMTEITQRGYGTAVTAPCIFSAGDHLGMAQIVSRIGLALDGQTGVSLDMAKEVWLNDPAWQGVRKLVENTFVERDWFQLFVAQTLAANLIFDVVYKFGDAGWKDAGVTVAMLTEFMGDWRIDEAKWSDSVIKTVAAESAHNKTLISQWAKHWIDRSVEAARPLSVALVGDDSAAAAAGDAANVKARALGLTL